MRTALGIAFVSHSCIYNKTVFQQLKYDMRSKKSVRPSHAAKTHHEAAEVTDAKRKKRKEKEKDRARQHYKRPS
jgi:hypothetical protein